MCVWGEGGVRFNIKKYVIFNCENWKWKLGFKETEPRFPTLNLIAGGDVSHITEKLNALIIVEMYVCLYIYVCIYIYI